MLQIANTRIGGSFHRQVATGVTIGSEGTPLVYVREGNATVVKPCVGGTTEQWAGVAFSRNNSLDRATFQYETTIPASGTLVVMLPHSPRSNEIRVVADGVALAADVAAGPGEYALSGNSLSFDAAEAGQSLVVTYAYTPTVAQSQQIIGDAYPGGLASTSLGVIGVIESGDIFTDQFDVTADWGTALKVYLGANGRFTPTQGSNTLVPNATVIQAPSAGQAFVGISLR